MSLFLSLGIHVLLITLTSPGAPQYSHGFIALDGLLTLYRTKYMLLGLYIANTQVCTTASGNSVNLNCMFLLFFADLHLETHSHAKSKN